MNKKNKKTFKKSIDKIKKLWYNKYVINKRLALDDINNSKQCFIKERKSIFMTNTKMTKKDYFKALLAIEEVKANDDYVAFINHEIELLEKKNGNRKPTKTQEENENIKEFILEVAVQPMTITEIMKAIQPNVKIELTNQKVSALANKLVEDALMIKTTEKRKSYFKTV